jgi:ribosome-associated heat shock protein Hsp15
LFVGGSGHTNIAFIASMQNADKAVHVVYRTCHATDIWSRESMQQAAEAPSGLARLDVWLWAARFFKTRALAKSAIESGKVEVAGQRAKPARQVCVGDALRIVRGEEAFQVEVLASSSKRGSAAMATALYREDDASRLLREQQRAQRVAERSGYRAPEHKPDKRARRLIQALGDIDAL